MIQVYYTKAKPPWCVLLYGKRLLEATEVELPDRARLVTADQPLVPDSHITGWIETESVVADGLEIRIRRGDEETKVEGTR